ncbi:MAG: gliding motility-associated C-terminal domain-containing protein [Bacteroidales bacterium]|nr:gliding motility-associated C-terminal domain-containing protein [Bacteroidales bacterium]
MSFKYKEIKNIFILMILHSVFIFFNTELAQSQFYFGGDGDGHSKETADNVNFSTISESINVLSVSSLNNNNTYGIGEIIRITVTFSGNVTVTGNPRILLETGSNDRYATYNSGSESSILIFTYTILQGDISSDLDYNNINSIDLNGGSIIDENGLYACLTLAEPGTTNSLSANKDIVIDGIKPIATIDLNPLQNSITNTSPIKFRITFSENVTDFDENDVNLSGTANPQNVNITDLNQREFIAEISGMLNDGTVVINVPADICLDRTAGNNNGTSIITHNTVVYDTNKPEVDITLDATQSTPSNSTVINFNANFSETVNNFDNSSVELSGTANPTTVDVRGGPLNYTIEVSGMTNDGTVLINIPADQLTDNAGNLNLASNNIQNQVIYDTEKPEITISSTETSPTSLVLIPFSVDFTEEVTNFDINDIEITNGSIDNLNSVISNKKWTGEITPISEGIISLQISDNKAFDLATNGNIASNIFEIEYLNFNNAPEILNQTFYINEDIENGFIVGNIIANDIDGDDILFNIKSGNIDNIFDIDTYSGEISVINSESINYNITAKYELTIEVEDNNSNSKKSEALITINIIDVEDNFEANNVFTPNSEKNRLWKIKDVEKYTDFELIIRNNSGIIVYKTKAYKNDWNGTYNNKPLPTGTYYYILSNLITKKTYSGFINLINE